MKVSLSDQIDMLLELNKKDEALQKAISCGDTDLSKTLSSTQIESNADRLVLFVLMRAKSGGSPHEHIIKLSKMKSLPLNLLLEVTENLRARRRLFIEAML